MIFLPLGATSRRVRQRFRGQPCAVSHIVLIVYSEVKHIRLAAELDVPPQPPEDASSRKRKLAAILHADVVGFQPPDGRG